MTTELLQKYANLAELTQRGVQKEINEALLQRTVIELTFDNIQYTIHRAILQAFTNMHFNPSNYSSNFEPELDRESVEVVAKSMAKSASTLGFILRSRALIKDVLSENGGKVQELVFSDSDDSIPQLVWRDADQIESMNNVFERIIVLSPQAVKYLLKPGQFAGIKHPPTMRSRLAKLVEAFHEMSSSENESESVSFRIFALEALSVEE